jgi:hypothetical protein
MQWTVQKKQKYINNESQNTTQKIKNWETRTLIKPGWNHVLQKGKQYIPALLVAPSYFQFENAWLSVNNMEI